ncbi:MAG: RNA polymerase sigma factor [Flavobacteriales bacterium]
MVNRELTEKAKQDLKLIKRALEKGDSRAYSQLMSKYRDPVFFMLFEKVNNKEIAKELTIEAFGKAFNKLSSYSSEYAFSTWLFTIAKNNCIDFLRKKKLPTLSLDATIDNEENSKPIIEIADNALTPDHYLIKSQRLQIIRRIVEKLKPNYRKLVKLRYFKEYTYEEISSELNIPLGTVKAQLHRSREQLFNILSGSEDYF